MKKRIVALLLCGLLAVSGCGTTTTQTSTSDYLQNVSVTSLPYPEMRYNDAVISVKDISLFQGYSEESYRYNPYVIVTLDISNLSEQQITHMTTADISRNSLDLYDVSVDVDYDSESNNISFSTMPLINHYIDGSDYVWIFYDYTVKARNDFSDMEPIISVKIIQDEMKGKSHVENTYKYRINESNSEISLDVKSDSELTETQVEMFIKGANKKMGKS